MQNLVKLLTKLEFDIIKKWISVLKKWTINVVVPLFLLVGFSQQLIASHKTNGLTQKVVPNFGSVLILAIVVIRYSSC